MSVVTRSPTFCRDAQGAVSRALTNQRVNPRFAGYPQVKNLSLRVRKRATLRGCGIEPSFGPEIVPCEIVARKPRRPVLPRPGIRPAAPPEIVACEIVERAPYRRRRRRIFIRSIRAPHVVKVRVIKSKPRPLIRCEFPIAVDPLLDLLRSGRR